MIDIKMIEIRDSMTCTAAFAVRFIGAASEQERWLLHKMGWGNEQIDGVVRSNIINGMIYQEKASNIHPTYLIDPNYGRCNYCPDDWGIEGNTFEVVHDYLIEHWDEVRSGDVVDVEFILKKTDKPKISDRFSSLSET